ncbi:hypothetical protein ACTXT7_017201, partial [Hymenolepis weldensis]
STSAPRSSARVLVQVTRKLFVLPLTQRTQACQLSGRTRPSHLGFPTSPLLAPFLIV